MGQNIATGWAINAPPSSLEAMIKSWYEEVALFDPRFVENFVYVKSIENIFFIVHLIYLVLNNYYLIYLCIHLIYFRFQKKYGHYSQVVWAKTTKIGCGFVEYMNGNKDTVFFVCNYGPSGNFPNQKVYEIRR